MAKTRNFADPLVFVSYSQSNQSSVCPFICKFIIISQFFQVAAVVKMSMAFEELESNSSQKVEEFKAKVKEQFNASKYDVAFLIGTIVYVDTERTDVFSVQPKMPGFSTVSTTIIC